MEKTKRLKVKYHGRDVGTMALWKGRLAAFEYSREWLADGFPISPFSLPLEQKVFMPKMDSFDGLFGVFADRISTPSTDKSMGNLSLILSIPIFIPVASPT